MKMIVKRCTLALLLSVLCPHVGLCAQPSITAAAPAVPGLGIANLDAVAVNSAAYKAAQAQRAVTFKAQLDQAETRRQQIVAQLQPLIDKFNKDRVAAKPDQASLQQQAQTIQQLQASAQKELQAILQPVALSDAYVLEQINDKLAAAAQTAMAKQKISVLIGPQNVLITGEANNLNPAILTELNAILPSVQLVPPSGWQPKTTRDAGAAQGGK